MGSWYSDPTGLAAKIVALVTAIAAAIGWVVTDEWSTIITAVVVGVCSLVAAWQARRHAFAPQTIVRTVNLQGSAAGGEVLKAEAAKSA